MAQPINETMFKIFRPRESTRYVVSKDPSINTTAIIIDEMCEFIGVPALSKIITA